MKTNRYLVSYVYGGYAYESIYVWAQNKKQVRKIMRAQFGANIEIRTIVKEEEE